MNIFNMIVLSVLFAGCLYFGFYQEVKGAENLAMFFSWFCVVLAFFYSNDKEGNERAKKENEKSTAPMFEVDP